LQQRIVNANNHGRRSKVKPMRRATHYAGTAPLRSVVHYGGAQLVPLLRWLVSGHPHCAIAKHFGSSTHANASVWD
jgi:hypothetical protein